jgi:hypothetical protein
VTAAAVIIRKEKEIVLAYQRARATSPETARSADGIGVHQGIAFRRLVSRAVLRAAPGGGARYYLDEPTWEARRTTRRRLAVVAMVLAALLAAGVALGVRAGM